MEQLRDASELAPKIRNRLASDDLPNIECETVEAVGKQLMISYNIHESVHSSTFRVQDRGPHQRGEDVRTIHNHVRLPEIPDDTEPWRAAARIRDNVSDYVPDDVSLVYTHVYSMPSPSGDEDYVVIEFRNTGLNEFFRFLSQLAKEFSVEWYR